MRILLISLLALLSLVPAARAQFVETARVSASTMQQSEWTTQVISAADGQQVISAGIDGRIVVSDAVTGKTIKDIPLPTIVLAIALAPNGRGLAAADAVGNVSLIDLEGGKVNVVFRGDKHISNAVAWSEDGKTVAAGGADGIVRLASADGKITGEIDPAHGDIMALAFTKDRLVIGLRAKDGKRSADVWDWQNKKLIRTFDEGPAGMRAISVSPDGNLLAIADYVRPTLLTMMFTGANGAEVSLRALPDSDEGTIVAIWDLTNGKRVALITGETGARSIAFSPDGQLLATAGPNGVMIHDIGSRTFTEVGRIDSQTSVDALAFTPDSKRLILARESVPLVVFGSGGIDKLTDPFFTSIVMQVREGLNSGVMVSYGAELRNPAKKELPSATGGSTLEIWRLDRRTSPAYLKTWEAVQSFFNDKTDEARILLQKVIKDNPNFGEAQRLMAVLFESKDIKKVQSLLEASVKADPNCVSCWRTLGDIQYKTKEYLDAIKSYDRALQLKPGYGLVSGHQADAYGALGVQLMSSENTEKTMDAAKGALSSAIKLRPGREEFYTNLGAAYYFRGDFDADIEMLLIAKRLHPDHARIYYNLGHAYRYKGDKQKAIDAYSRYVQMGEPGEEARVEKAKDFITALSK
jgi:WD40 repeat protein/Tfp pilus assembly protein PilF